MRDDTARTPIRAIETRYAGHRFRSRLEARWAVFFNALGIDWQYEPEGFELASGHRYLPDFHLPGIGWVEIKPTYSAEALSAIEAVADAHGENGYLIAMPEIPDPAAVHACGVQGMPGWIGYWTPTGTVIEYGPGIYVSGDAEYAWCECPYCGAIGIQYHARSGRNQHRPTCRLYRDLSDAKNYNGNSHRLITAYAMARAARFEHGETPR